MSPVAAEMRKNRRGVLLMTRFQRRVAKWLGVAALGLAAARGVAVAEGPEFTLTSDHVRLLRQLRVVWIEVEAGAPVIDVEMPFGSTEIHRDVARILGHPGVFPAPPSGTPRERAGQMEVVELPAGLLQAVEILLDAGKLRPGSYTVINGMRERIAVGKAPSFYDAASPKIPATPTFPFQVTEDHLKLIAHANFNFFGFDLKRPYGDMTYYWLDIADALGVEIPPRTADGYAFTPEQIARFDRLHGEMLFTFQALLQYAQLEPGVYVASGGRWTRRAR
jgi:hypothetical protein